MAIVDAHFHLFSRPYFEAMAAGAPGPEPAGVKLARLAQGGQVEIPEADLSKHVRRWLAEFDRHDVAKAICFSSAPEEAASVEEAVEIARGRLVPVALANPLAPDAPGRVRTLLTRHGFRGVLLFPALHRYAIGGPEARAVLTTLAESGGFAYVQCGMLRVPLRDLLGYPRTADLAHANPLDLLPVADRFRSTSFVVPHFGAGFFRETLMLGAQCENVFVDTSSSNGWTATDPAAPSLADVFRRTLGVFGPERVLFGTDSGTFPRGWRADLLAAQTAALREAGASPSATQKILGGNAERLIGGSSAGRA